MGRRFGEHREAAQAHRNHVAARSLEAIPAGATVAYVDASCKGAVARCAVIVATGYPEIVVTTELILDPGDHDVNRAELAAIIAAAEFGPDYIVSDSLTAYGWLDGGMYEGIPVVVVPGDTDIVPGHRLAHDLAVSARKEAEEG